MENFIRHFNIKGQGTASKECPVFPTNMFAGGICHDSEGDTD